MAEETGAAKAGPPKSEYDVYLEERKLLIDAARESARTFDKAILTFAAAAFGFSVALLKEAARIPLSGPWYGWGSPGQHLRSAF